MALIPIRHHLGELGRRPLTQIATQLGYQPDPADPGLWRLADSVIRITDNHFYDHLHHRGGNSALDLVMHAKACSCHHAIDFLDRHRDRPLLPSPDARSWKPVRHHLSTHCALHPQLVDNCHRHQMLYADSLQSAVFPCTDFDSNISGAEMFGTKPQRRFHRLSLGSRISQGGFWLKSKPQPPVSVVIVSDAIEALSLLQLYHPFPESVLITSAASVTKALPQWLAKFRELPLVCAFSNTRSATRSAQMLVRHLPCARILSPPNAPTWNRLLVVRNGQPLKHRDQCPNPSPYPDVYR